MDPQEYADARWHSLLRATVELGIDEDDAPAVVRRVLAAQHRRIRRADDPDPLVLGALEQEVRGRAAPRRPAWRALAGAVLAAAAVLAVVALTRPDEPPVDRLDADQVPSLFGFGRAPAQQLLTSLGLEVTVEPTRACEVADRVIGTDPGRGATYERGDPITLYTAVPANITCLTDYQQRSAAWQLVDLATGRGPGPPFADRVLVYTGDGSATVLTRTQAADPDAWSGTGVLAALRTAAGRVRLIDDNPLTYAAPALRVVRATEALGSCGVPEPVAPGAGEEFAALILAPTRAGCPLRLEVYREVGGRIRAVALYAGSS